jgi:cytochrome c oxidase cbb3-type subunit 3
LDANRNRLLVFVVLAAVVVASGVFWSVERAKLAARLVTTPAESLPRDATMVKFAHKVAAPVYAKTCARCHGPSMRGAQGLAPNLTDSVWLYDSGRVSDIERTILYGVRSGHAKSHNITDMPAVGRLGILNDAEINDVVAYVMTLSHRPADQGQAARGQALFRDKGNCFDCHAPDGSGNPDYGSTDLTANVWVYGGDQATLFRSVRDGRHGLMPAFIDTLNPTQIRALALEVYMRSHPPQPLRQVASN